MRVLTTFIFTLLCLCAGAQQSYTQQLQDGARRRGKITLHQDMYISNLVNGIKVQQTDQLTGEGGNNEQIEPTIIQRNGTRAKMTGFRIQIYEGSNTRQSKQQAEKAEQTVKQLMPHEMVYTDYINPRWVCRVGDYRSYEEAFIAMRKLQTAGKFQDAVIVKTKVQVLID